MAPLHLYYFPEKNQTHLLSKKHLRKLQKSMIISKVNVHQFAEPQDTMYFSNF